MRLFLTRRDEDYLKTLRERLTIAGLNGLLARAVMEKLKKS